MQTEIRIILQADYFLSFSPNIPTATPITPPMTGHSQHLDQSFARKPHTTIATPDAMKIKADSFLLSIDSTSCYFVNASVSITYTVIVQKGSSRIKRFCLNGCFSCLNGNEYR